MIPNVINEDEILEYIYEFNNYIKLTYEFYN